MPPLRERPDDIPLLANHFAQKFAQKMGKTVLPVPPETIKALQNYDYPGNIRELENIIERAVILSDDGILRIEFIDSPAFSKTNSSANFRTLDDFQRSLIVQTLKASAWRIGGANGAAERLGLNRTTLISKMRKLGISRREQQFAV
jgi:transcriptional regulator with GAF, ATPase, and Fis domain